jgi:glycosyltransferase involved in cell wall biosynthesis
LSDINNTEYENLINQNINQYKSPNSNEKEERLKILSKGRNYIDNCLKEVSLNSQTNFSKVDEPLISVIIPVFNGEKTIKMAIKSIQNQNIKEIEIILVNDFSNDNSLSIIQELQKTDLRISIINNNKNYGTLYSRCVGALISKGKYIFALDNDDMFFDEDVFDYISKKAMKDKHDIVGFKSVYVHSYNSSIYQMKDGFFTNYTNKFILHQPMLGRYIVSENGGVWPNDYTIWGKCIKTEIYKQAVNSLGIKRYSTYINWGEDASIVFVIFNIAQSFLFVHKYGIMHIQNHSFESKTEYNKNNFFGEVFLIDIIYDFSKNDTDKNLAVYHALYTKRNYDLTSETYKNDLSYLKNVLNKIMNSTYITDENKNKLKLDYKDLIS